MRLLKYWKKYGNKIICIDFDGVIHGYQSGFKGMGCIPDPPVVSSTPYAPALERCGEEVSDSIDWIRALMEQPDFMVAIYSSRSTNFAGRRAMKKWLKKWGLTRKEIKKIWFPVMKPPAWVTIDDRAVHFDGNFPSVEFIRAYVPWNKKGL